MPRQHLRITKYGRHSAWMQKQPTVDSTVQYNGTMSMAEELVLQVRLTLYAGSTPMTGMLMSATVPATR